MEGWIHSALTKSFIVAVGCSIIQPGVVSAISLRITRRKNTEIYKKFKGFNGPINIGVICKYKLEWGVYDIADSIWSNIFGKSAIRGPCQFL